MDPSQAVRPVLVLLVALLLAAASAQAGPREFQALVGAGQDTESLNAFFPTALRVRVGDSVTWRIESDEIHTVTFARGVDPEQLAFAVPGADGLVVNPIFAFPSRPPGAPVETYGGSGLANSGLMSKAPGGPDAPPNDTFTLTFDQPGTYTYYCLIHERFMLGTVTVEPADAAAGPSPEEVLAEARAEIEPMLAGLQATRAASQEARVEPGPDGTSFVHVRAGAFDVLTPDTRSELLEFLPQDVTVRAGDTVVWGSTGFHTVTLTPLPPTPPLIMPEPQEMGPPILHLNPEVIMPSKPAGVYDPLQFYNSGDFGFFSLGGASWALTFEEPGVYEYVCAVHEELGMRGTITVEARP